MECGTLRGKFLRQHERLARTLDLRPVAIEVVDQPLLILALHRAIEGGFVRELIGCLEWKDR